MPPVHLDVLATTARARSAGAGRSRRRAGLRHLQPEPPAHRGVQAVGGDQPAGPAGRPPRRPAASCSTWRTDPCTGRIAEVRRRGLPAPRAARCGVRRGPGPRRKPAVDRAAGCEVADADERPALRARRRGGPARATAAGIRPFAAGLVDRRRLRGSTTTTRQPGPAGADRGGQPDRAAAGDQHVDVGHAGRLGASAAAPAPRRPPGSAGAHALATVNTTAVTQALCTSGRATPSTDDGDVVRVPQPAVRPGARPRTGPGTTTTRVHHCRPSVRDAPPAQALGGQRRAASIGQPSQAGTAGRRASTSTTAPTSSPVCSTTMAG